MDPRRLDVDIAFRQHEEWSQEAYGDLIRRLDILERQVAAMIEATARNQTGVEANGRAIKVLIDWIRRTQKDRWLAAMSLTENQVDDRFLARLGEIDIRFIRRKNAGS